MKLFSTALLLALALAHAPQGEAADLATSFLPGTQIPSELGIPGQNEPLEAPGVVLPYRIGDPIGVRDSADSYAMIQSPGILLPASATVETASETEEWLDELPAPEEIWQRQRDDVTRYEAMLEELEYTSGAWGAQLGEELMSLGQLLQQQGEYTRALDVYTRAAHIHRVNHGLNSLEQLAPLQRLVETNIALNRWADADRHQRYAYYVQTRAFARDDPRLIPALDNLARWNMQTFSRAIDGEPLLKLLEAYTLYNAAVALVTRNFGLNDPRYVSYLRDMTVTAYRLARHGTQADIERAVIRQSAGEMYIAPTELSTPLSRLSGYGEGEQALRNIYEHYSSPHMQHEENIELRRAQALADLGDWYMVFNRRQAAFRSYSEAHALLRDAGLDPDLIFGEPVSLPGFLNRSGEAYDNNASLRRGYIDLSVDVSQYGRVNNVALLGAEPPVASSVTASIVRQTRSLILRPRFGPDGPEPVQEATLRFPFWY